MLMNYEYAMYNLSYLYLFDDLFPLRFRLGRGCHLQIEVLFSFWYSYPLGVQVQLNLALAEIQCCQETL